MQLWSAAFDEASTADVLWNMRKESSSSHAEDDDGLAW